jgi:hypothetical protein
MFHKNRILLYTKAEPRLVPQCKLQLREQKETDHIHCFRNEGRRKLLDAILSTNMLPFGKLQGLPTRNRNSTTPETDAKVV